MGSQIERQLDLDGAKFIYIVMMVVYHYYYNTVYVLGFGVTNYCKYLSLVSGSFPFLAGYLIGANISKTDVTNYKKVCAKTFTRGFRLIMWYISANIILIGLMSRSSLEIESLMSAKSVFAKVFGSPKDVVFDILLSLGLVCWVCAFLLAVRVKFQFSKVFAILVLLLAIALSIFSPYIYLACGLLGFWVGAVIGNTDNLVLYLSNVQKVLVMVFCILFAVFLGDFYTDPRNADFLYLGGVFCLFIGIISAYQFTVVRAISCRFKIIGFFARYSLVIYISHVPVVLVLRDLISNFGLGAIALQYFLPFILLFFFFIYSFVILIDYARKYSDSVDRVYRLLIG